MPHPFHPLWHLRRAGWLRRQARRRSLLGLCLLALVGLLYAGAAAGVRLSRHMLPGNEVRLPGAVSSLPGLSQSAPDRSQRINFLILGIDHRTGQGSEYVTTPGGEKLEDPGRSDTIAVLSIQPATKSAVLLSIPRDLWLEVPDGKAGWTLDRINEAYYTGEALKLPGGGAATAATAITHNFGIQIDHYVALDFAGFMDLIDAEGGLDLDIPQTITATVLPKANTGGYEYTFFAGHQHLNGELALAYARFRTDSRGDFGRIGRQQQVALAARDRALSLGWFSRAPLLWDKYNAALQTDLHAWEIPGFALLARQVESRGIRTHSLGEPGATTEVVLPSGADVLLPNPSIMARIIGNAFGDTAFRDAAYTRLRRLYPFPGGAPAAGQDEGAGETDSTATESVRAVDLPAATMRGGSALPGVGRAR